MNMENLENLLIFSIRNGKARKLQPVKNQREKNIQKIFEDHLEQILDIKLIGSEVQTTVRGRIDTLGIDNQGNPVIIEYKMRGERAAISQAMGYLDWLRQHGRDTFEKLKNNKNVREKTNWKKPRVICIGKYFNKGDILLAKNINVELLLLHFAYYENNILLLESIIKPTQKTRTIKKPQQSSKAKSPFRFSMLKIELGAKLVFSENENIKAIVHNDKKIKYQGRITSLSAVASKILDRSASGPRHWKYKGELLSDLRMRIEGNQSKDKPWAPKIKKSHGRRPPFRFTMVGIKPGEELVFIWDENMKATVHDHKSIMYRGKKTSLSAVATKFHGRSDGWRGNGPKNWKYKDECLRDMRDRIEGRDKK